jgi:hypothetical protein
VRDLDEPARQQRFDRPTVNRGRGDSEELVTGDAAASDGERVVIDGNRDLQRLTIALDRRFVSGDIDRVRARGVERFDGASASDSRLREQTWPRPQRRPALSSDRPAQAHDC